MKKPYRILHVFGRLDRGGAETMVMNLYRNIDRSKIQFDFLIHTKDECAYSKEIQSLGGRIINIPKYTGTNHKTYTRLWNDFFKKNKEYKIVHGHVRSTAAIYLDIANKYGRTTISHSHNTSSGTGFSAIAKNLLQYRVKYVADYFFACSAQAGEWLFGKHVQQKSNFHIIKNAIDMNKFKYDHDRRLAIRDKMSLNGRFVVGTVGRLTQQKNPYFIIDVVKELVKINKDAVFIWVGTGELAADIKTKVNEHQLENNIMFLGAISEVEDILLAMDVFILPSLWEGLGIVVVEAQASQLKCLVSEKVPNEAVISANVQKVHLKDGPKRWAHLINEHSLTVDSRTKEQTIDDAYDIQTNVVWLSNFYERIWP
ncbi:glycosyltransferase family 1 protein [Aureibacillus halotolerans]|uniref:Glycosyltransferase involved in cell wall biosynthesis n=1 Tax=Aureibacillus halotolerans TaxID=1508390 RepID=A0A4V3D4V6_9BACI|nr:glycosyltransferase family 1 protein [Aureibacillus halotolerans]TDQ37647.1 glycosyltransferase involved in cell wall biosynthesis [Aureibacillus halotolerans]